MSAQDRPPTGQVPTRNAAGLDLYRDAGVDVARGDGLVDWLQEQHDQGVTPFGARVQGIGGFAALFRPDFRRLQDPLLVTSTDGVGTKVLLAIDHGQVTGLGQDLVAMCVNDLYTVGGRPLFFLDYYATGAIEEAQFKDVLRSIRSGLAQCGALLLGGETAEMPGLYGKGHFDLAGFVVGVVDGRAMLGPDRVQVGDELWAMPSSGFHSNGYSLLRRWLKDMDQVDPQLISQLLTPTRIYHEIPLILERVGPSGLHALAHITGGGISGNLPRVMPRGTVCRIDSKSLPTPSWMRSFIEGQGVDIMSQESVFNLGCGMIAAVAPQASSEFSATLASLGQTAVRIGEVCASAQEDDEAIVTFH